MELQQLTDSLLEAAENVNEVLMEGRGPTTRAQMKTAILDVTSFFEKATGEMTLALAGLSMTSKSYFMDILIEHKPDICFFVVPMTRKVALSQGIVQMVSSYSNKEVENFIDHATRVAMTNGENMEDMKLWFAKHPGAGRNWGNMIRAVMVVIWTLTADDKTDDTGDYLDDVTGQEAINLWNKATRAANSVLPLQARLHPRRADPYVH